ncbi:hypothetical protein B0J14DRAFT_577113 [Halenospora varia]|nr:hypothetical protein B0J14DRAFT_577113 [Halenospora varia]
MHSSTFLAVFTALVSTTTADGNIGRRAVKDPVATYLTRVCYPLFSNDTRDTALRLRIKDIIPSLANSPFPCEQQLYIEDVCTANGTTEVDFLAEQQCLCTGGYWTAREACNSCFFAHGYQNETQEAAASQLSALSTAECSPSPPFQPFTNLYPSPNISTISLTPSLTLGNDRFPNNTAVSNYYTGTASLTPGAITGEATARQTSWTNTGGVRFTPTSTPSQFSSLVASSTSLATGTSSTGTNGAVATPCVGVKALGGMVAGVVGVVALL